MLNEKFDVEEYELDLLLDLALDEENPTAISGELRDINLEDEDEANS